MYSLTLSIKALSNRIITSNRASEVIFDTHHQLLYIFFSTSTEVYSTDRLTPHQLGGLFYLKALLCLL